MEAFITIFLIFSCSSGLTQGLPAVVSSDLEAFSSEPLQHVKKSQTVFENSFLASTDKEEKANNVEAGRRPKQLFDSENAGNLFSSSALSEVVEADREGKELWADLDNEMASDSLFRDMTTSDNKDVRAKRNIEHSVEDDASVDREADEVQHSYKVIEGKPRVARGLSDLFYYFSGCKEEKECYQNEYSEYVCECCNCYNECKYC